MKRRVYSPMEIELARRTHLVEGAHFPHHPERLVNAITYEGSVRGCAKRHAAVIADESEWERLLLEAGRRGWKGDGGMATPEEVGRRLAEEKHTIAWLAWPDEGDWLPLLGYDSPQCSFVGPQYAGREWAL